MCLRPGLCLRFPPGRGLLLGGVLFGLVAAPLLNDQSINLLFQSGQVMFDGSSDDFQVDEKIRG